MKKKNAELLSAQHQIIVSEKLGAIGKILSIISHELKNPLFSLRNKLSILEQQENFDKKIINEMFNDISFCVDIIDNTNAYRKTQELNLEKNCISNLILESILMLNIPANIEIKTDFKDDIEILCDLFQCKIVIMNIIKNAVEKFETGGGIIKIETIDADKFLKIIISDNGYPLNESIDIFEAFVTTKSYGAGLGLAFSKLIIEKHNGKLYAINSCNWVSFIIELKK